MEWWFTQNGGVRKDGSAAPKPPPTPPAFEFLRAVRVALGGATQERLSEMIGAHRTMVGKWEMEEGGDEPSWPYIGKILVLLGVTDVTGKRLRTYTDGRVESPPMRNMESEILSELRKLPEEKLLPIYRQVVTEVTKHEHSASQTPAALKKG